MATAADESCWFCRERRGEDEPPGGWIHQDTHWLAGHAPVGHGPHGLVILESRRHFLDASEMTPEEAATFGSVLGRITGAIRDVVGAERVYTWASMKAHPHLHVWLLPWWPGGATGIDYLANSISISGYTADEAARTAEELREKLA
jgi:diadenosine tetraphosphate (Ap4A) HIT family hydrolase